MNATEIRESILGEIQNNLGLMAEKIDAAREQGAPRLAEMEAHLVERRKDLEWLMQQDDPAWWLSYDPSLYWSDHCQSLPKRPNLLVIARQHRSA